MRFLPEIDTPDAKLLIEKYPSADREQLEYWRNKYGYRNIKNLIDGVRVTYGIKRNILRPIGNEQMSEAEQLIVNLPPIKIREYKPQKTRKHDEEEQVLLLSDGHAAKITETYNNDVYKDRNNNIFDSAVKIAELHRHIYPINKLHILYVGDNVQGENPYQGSRVGAVSMGARDQVTKLALPTQLGLISALKQHYQEIEIDCFMGNHGRYSKEAPETSNWDMLLYDLIKTKLDGGKGIKINVHDEYGGVVNIRGFRFHCSHGDAVRSINGIPLFALTRRIRAWYIQYNGFNYAVCGHFHKFYNDEIASQIELFMNSTLVSDDDWALKKLGISSKPSQWTFGVHNEFGVTWRYPLLADKAFIPRKSLIEVEK